MVAASAGVPLAKLAVSPFFAVSVLVSSFPALAVVFSVELELLQLTRYKAASTTKMFFIKC